MDRRLIGFERGVALNQGARSIFSPSRVYTSTSFLIQGAHISFLILVHQVLMGLIAWIGVRPWGNRQACTSRRSSSRIYRQLSCSRDDRCPCLAIARARLGLLLVI